MMPRLATIAHTAISMIITNQLKFQKTKRKGIQITRNQICLGKHGIDTHRRMERGEGSEKEALAVRGAGSRLHTNCLLGRTFMLKIMVPGEGIANKNVLCPWQEEPEALQTNTGIRILPKQNRRIRQVVMNMTQFAMHPKK